MYMRAHVRMKEFLPGSKRDPCCVRPMCTGSNKNRPGFQISDQATLNADPTCLRRYAMKPSPQKAKDHWVANFFRATKPKSLKARCGFRFIPAGYSDVKPATVPI